MTWYAKGNGIGNSFYEEEIESISRKTTNLSKSIENAQGISSEGTYLPSHQTKEKITRNWILFHIGTNILWIILDHRKSGPVSYIIVLPPTMKAHDVFHIYLLKKYVHDVDHVLYWFVIQVESKGEFQPKPHCNLLHMKFML